jgi:hypothetical protein
MKKRKTIQVERKGKEKKGEKRSPLWVSID